MPHTVITMTKAVGTPRIKHQPNRFSGSPQKGGHGIAGQSGDG